MIFISLGSDCAVAYQLQKLNLREQSYPFDWMLSTKLDIIIKIISNDFINLFEPDQLIFSPEINPRYNYLDQDWNFNSINTYRVNHKLYGLQFNHDFPINYDLVQIRSKYSRRIERFKLLMMGEEEKILVRIGPETDRAKIGQLEDLFNKLQYKNYQLKFLSYSNIESGEDWRRDHFNWRDFFIN